MTAHVTVVGSLNMDLVARAPRIPRPGETIIGGEFRNVPGGKGANQAIAAARLGATVSMVGRVGRDTFAGPLLDNLDADGIDHTFVVQDPEAATGVALIVVDDGGENSIVVASGANMRLSPADVDGAEAAIAGADALLLQLEIPLETVIRAAKIARARAVKIILNPAPARSLPAELLSLVDVLIPNESETALLTGLPVGDQAEAKTAAAALQDSGVGTVILTLGERGAMLATEGKTELFPAFDVTPVDTTAAGDAFVGGFAVALAEGRTLSEAVRWGNGAGGLAATKLGAQPSLPARRDLERLLATGGNR
ncbi:MAG: ribokinase [Chloroflexi bacterium]|nr:MAG: ribokinase [Anaerolineaceae bacterium 4572_32.2]RLC75587.1 MAG: ribokinase [Chloroflexota bacterium]RLC77828.1 MAG: ribokinase [Chloroflexota bacterium]